MAGRRSAEGSPQSVTVDLVHVIAGDLGKIFQIPVVFHGELSIERDPPGKFRAAGQWRERAGRAKSRSSCPEKWHHLPASQLFDDPSEGRNVSPDCRTSAHPLEFIANLMTFAKKLVQDRVASCFTSGLRRGLDRAAAADEMNDQENHRDHDQHVN